MDLGKVVRVITVPDNVPAQQPVREEPIPLPDNWPLRAPVKAPEKVPAEAD